MYQILVVDYDEAYCAKVYSDAEIVQVFHEKSYVPKKHKCGGQSAARFARIRQEKIKHWFKEINCLLKNVDGEIIIGMSSMYRNQFKHYLSTYNLDKIIRWEKSEYNNLSGIYQMVTLLEKK